MHHTARRPARLACPAVVVALAGAALAPGPAAAADTVVSCHTWASFPNVLISSARNMTCRAARKDMRSYRGQIFRTFKTPGGFRCGRVSGGRLGGQWRCVKKRNAYRFDFGD
jgi:hypothetical protein